MNEIFVTLKNVLGLGDKVFYYLLIIMVIDYFTGIISAVIKKELDSEKGFYGFLKKTGYIMIYFLSSIIDYLMQMNGIIREIVLYFFIANDGLSILENLGEIGVPLPKKLYDLLNQLKNEKLKEKETEIKTIKTVNEVINEDLETLKEEVLQELERGDFNDKE